MVKKGQVKVQQMAFMLLAVFIFFALVGMILLKVGAGNLRDEATKLEQENAILLVSKLANSPEFACGASFGPSIGDCVDMDKAMILSENIEEYENFWGVSSIEIIKIYPSSEDLIPCDRENYPNCNFLEILPGKGVYYSNYVVLCRKEIFNDKIYAKCDLGKIMVSYENFE